MKRTLVPSAALLLLVACQSQSLTPSPHDPSQSIPALTVNDSCSSHTSSTDCQADTKSSCTWMTVAADACPAGASCPAGVCMTANSCAGLTSASTCQADANCVWSAIVATATTPALCPVGQTCGGGGFCFERGPSGNTCLCVQPLACPASGACPPVQCDCPPPPTADGGAVGGGGTCTCDCPACPAGASCPACDCACGQPGGGCGGTTGGTGTGGATGSGGATGTGGGPGTCICNCPNCPAGEPCPACSCACSNGATTTTTTPSSGTGGASGAGTDDTGAAPGMVCGCPACPAGAACAPCDCGTTPPADPCTAHTDVASCTADTADACGWTSLNIECITAPCPTGACAQQKLVLPVDAGTGSGGGGCACACPACAPGETCPPCACNCCPAAPAQGPVTLQPEPVAVDARAAPTPL